MKIGNFTPLMTSKQVSFGMAISQEAVEYALKKLDNKNNASLDEYVKLNKLVKKAAKNESTDVVLYDDSINPDYDPPNYCTREKGSAPANLGKARTRDLAEAVKIAEGLNGENLIEFLRRRHGEDKQKANLRNEIIRLAQEKWNSENE